MRLMGDVDKGDGSPGTLKPPLRSRPPRTLFNGDLICPPIIRSSCATRLIPISA